MMGGDNGSGDPEVLREEIRRTRVELSHTLEALAAKADVKARLRESTDQARQRMRVQAAQTRQRLREQAAQASSRMRGQGGARTFPVRRTPVPVGALVAGAFAVIAVLMWRRRRR